MAIFRLAKQQIQLLLAKWLAKRLPARVQHVLSQRTIFILPTRFGLTYLGLVILLFVLGTNYQNNLILFSCFLLASLFLTTIWHSYANLSGLTITAKQATVTGFPTQIIALKITLNSTKRRYALRLGFERNNPIKINKTNGLLDIQVPCCFVSRGVYSLPRLRIESQFPLGLIKTWSLVKFPTQLVVYPEPKKPSPHWLTMIMNGAKTLKSSGENQQTSAEQWLPLEQEVDDFNQLTRYQPGESLSKVAWKQLAQKQQWWSKQFQTTTSASYRFSLQQFQAIETELALQYLCYLLQQAETQQCFYGLTLSRSVSTEINQGSAHLIGCLTLLAHYPSEAQ